MSNRYWLAGMADEEILNGVAPQACFTQHLAYF